MARRRRWPGRALTTTPALPGKNLGRAGTCWSRVDVLAPHSQQIGPDLQLVTHPLQRDPCGQALPHQPNRLDLELRRMASALLPSTTHRDTSSPRKGYLRCPPNRVNSILPLIRLVRSIRYHPVILRQSCPPERPFRAAERSQREGVAKAL